MSKVLTLTAILLTMTACGTASFQVANKPVNPTQCDIVDDYVVCDNGITFPSPSNGQDGTDGSNGNDGVDGIAGTDGQDGENAVILSQVKVAANSCTQVAKGIWVESIQNSTFFDVYYNSECQDAKGEFCDNVEPSEGSTGQFGENKRGGAEVCWADNVQISAEKKDKDLLVRVLDFN